MDGTEYRTVSIDGNAEQDAFIYDGTLDEAANIVGFLLKDGNFVSKRLVVSVEVTTVSGFNPSNVLNGRITPVGNVNALTFVVQGAPVIGFPSSTQFAEGTASDGGDGQ